METAMATAKVEFTSIWKENMRSTCVFYDVDDKNAPDFQCAREKKIEN